MALPGVWPTAAQAQAETEAPPQISLRLLHYQDEQPGLKRVRVVAPAVSLQMPIAARWSLAGSATADSVSGASPRYHTAISGASRMSDDRRAGDFKLTRHEERYRWSVGVVGSDERDYRSRALSVDIRWDSDDRNRSWQAGAAYTRDRIGSVDDPDLHGQRRTREVLFGVTQVLTRLSAVQLTLSHSAGIGFFDDPYKSLDRRPASRHQSTTVLRWNHHFERSASTLRLNWRRHRDSWGIRADSLSAEWVFDLHPAWSIAPLVRLHTQNAARFYLDPVYSFLGAPFPPGWLESPPATLSLDQRLAAFGARTWGLKLAVSAGGGWSGELRAERYRQRGEWRLGGNGSPGLAPLSATLLQVGLTRRF